MSTKSRNAIIGSKHITLPMLVDKQTGKSVKVRRPKGLSLQQLHQTSAGARKIGRTMRKAFQQSKVLG
jgi:hypothetical protein